MIGSAAKEAAVTEGTEANRSWSCRKKGRMRSGA